MSKSKRYRRGSISVDIDVDCQDVLDQIEDEALLEEVKDRDLVASGNVYDVIPAEELRDAYDALLCGRTCEARAIIERLICPKWKDEKACEKQYREATKARA